jgi:hypothetical protein
MPVAGISPTFARCIAVCVQYIGRHLRTKVTNEPVLGVTDTGDLITEDALVRTSGDTSAMQVGDVVPILWNQRTSGTSGRRQTAVALRHHAQKAQPGGPIRVAVGAIEELLLIQVAPQPDSFGALWGGKDVYFRNGQQFTRLNLTDIIESDAIQIGGSWLLTTGAFEVRWGQDDSTFVVRVMQLNPAHTALLQRYHVFRLNRPRGVAMAGTAAATFIKTIELPAPVTLPGTETLSMYPHFSDGGGDLITSALLVFPTQGTIQDYLLTESLDLLWLVSAGAASFDMTTSPTGTVPPDSPFFDQVSVQIAARTSLFLIHSVQGLVWSSTENHGVPTPTMLVFGQGDATEVQTVARDDAFYTGIILDWSEGDLTRRRVLWVREQTVGATATVTWHGNPVFQFSVIYLFPLFVRTLGLEGPGFVEEIPLDGAPDGIVLGSHTPRQVLVTGYGLGAALTTTGYLVTPPTAATPGSVSVIGQTPTGSPDDFTLFLRALRVLGPLQARDRLYAVAEGPISEGGHSGYAASAWPATGDRAHVIQAEGLTIVLGQPLPHDTSLAETTGAMLAAPQDIDPDTAVARAYIALPG